MLPSPLAVATGQELPFRLTVTFAYTGRGDVPIDVLDSTISNYEGDSGWDEGGVPVSSLCGTYVTGQTSLRLELKAGAYDRGS